MNDEIPLGPDAPSLQPFQPIDKLAAALSKAQGAMESAKKDSANPFFHSKYADLASVWDACRKPLSDNELAIIQMPGTDDEGLYVDTLLAHSSGQSISGRIHVRPTQDTPQGVGSAITYGRRYGLQAMVGIAPEDDDGNAASQGKHDRIEERQERRERQAQPPKYHDRMTPQGHADEMAPQSHQNDRQSVGRWQDVECTYGKKGGPLRGKKLGELNPSNLQNILDKFPEGHLVDQKDRKMVAALAMWKGEAGQPPKPADDEIPGLGIHGPSDHPKREELSSWLDWLNPGVTQEEFMCAMREAKLIPMDANSFTGMSEETATKFLADPDTTLQIVRMWQEKKEGIAS